VEETTDEMLATVDCMDGVDMFQRTWDGSSEELSFPLGDHPRFYELLKVLNKAVIHTLKMRWIHYFVKWNTQDDSFA
jgi:hypothetical protein